MRARRSHVVYLLTCCVAVNVAVAMAEPPAAQDVERSRVCMLKDEVEPQAGTAYEYEGKKYYLCCPMCVTTFKQEPARYSKAHDPVSGQAVDKATAPILAYKSKAYFFASEESRAAFAKEPEHYVRSTSHDPDDR